MKSSPVVTNVISALGTCRLTRVTALHRCTCLRRLWRRGRSKWECRALWLTASRLKPSWSVPPGRFALRCELSLQTHASCLIWCLLPGRWEGPVRYREAPGSVARGSVHPRRNNHLRASHPGAGRCESGHHERCGVRHREGQRARPQVFSKMLEVTLALPAFE